MPASTLYMPEAAARGATAGGARGTTTADYELDLRGAGKAKQLEPVRVPLTKDKRALSSTQLHAAACLRAPSRKGGKVSLDKARRREKDLRPFEASRQAKLPKGGEERDAGQRA